ncbi:MAG: RNA-binding protein [Actinobacteria bacterium]|nr:RNA-binding protein [Actinomycetota bacterium]MBU4240233.1 RNA-binding protein [Actinomycetota bacterium]MBU4385780.1 RNA-binding protein [Actinomycetota bacterium]MBU4490194.1 RNA-binding protein [Actinomycetota bacterium]MCG2794503.1 RNA-binding protein [Actinomycetes bacterium]
MRIYVGNLSYGTDSDSLRQAFEEFGTVESSDVIMDRNTNRSRGFGFVEMPSDEEGKAAIEGLDSKELDSRQINVNEARPRRDDDSRGGGGGGGGGSYRY